jgi:hypothetical protein
VLLAAVPTPVMVLVGLGILGALVWAGFFDE